MNKKPSRFAETDFENKQLTPIYGYWSHPLVPLEQALQTILPRINDLARYIKVAKENCTYPTEHGLTRDESAALYLYTMEWGNDSFYRVLNKALRAEDRSSLKPWFAYLKLFDTAFSKLPSLKKVIWRGVRKDVSKDLKENQELTWWSINSCSSSVHVVKNFIDQNSTLFLIEAANGKDVSAFTNFPNENEVLLGSGTKLRVVSDTLDHIGGLHVVHLKEVTDKCDEPVSTTKTSATERILEMAYATLTSVGQSELPKTIRNTVFGRDNSTKNLERVSLCSPTGERYEGTVKDGKKHGQGTFHYINGDVYTGDWKHDQMDGEGTFRWSFGNRYEGDYKNGKMHGHGSFYFINGEKYEGNFVDNMRNGYGEYSWPHGDYYEGEHKDNNFHGRGKHIYADGRVQKGTWKNNQFVN